MQGPPKYSSPFIDKMYRRVKVKGEISTSNHANVLPNRSHNLIIRVNFFSETDMK